MLKQVVDYFVEFFEQLGELVTPSQEPQPIPVRIEPEQRPRR